MHPPLGGFFVSIKITRKMLSLLDALIRVIVGVVFFTCAIVGMFVIFVILHLF